MLSILLSMGLLAGIVMVMDNPQQLVNQLWQFNSFLLVVVGTFAATILQFPTRDCLKFFGWIWAAFRPKRVQFLADIHAFHTIAVTYQRDGVVGLTAILETVKSPFLSKALNAVVDGATVAQVTDLCQQTTRSIKKRHELAIFFFEQMGKYAPSFGLLGTVIGLIQLLAALDSPSELGQGMALALITTFYGILLANGVFSPIAGRLYVLDQHEERHNDMITMGIREMMAGVSPLLIQEKMLATVHNRPTVVA
jgi:chemotaxis protein MotA